MHESTLEVLSPSTQSDEKQEGQSDEPSIPKRVSSASAKSIDAQSDEMQQGQSAEPSSWEQKTSESQKSADGDTPGAKTSNTKLTDRQKEAATKLFAEKIKKGVKLQLAQARSKMCTCTHLRMLALRKEQSKQLINHINYLIDKRPVASSEALPAISKKRQIIEFDNYQSDDGSSTMKSGRRQQWNVEDTNLIEENFREYLQCPLTDHFLFKAPFCQILIISCFETSFSLGLS